MALSVAPARTAEEKAEVYAFRYRVYVQEMGIETPDADHERRHLDDPLDACSESWALRQDGRVMGSLRLTRLVDVPDPAEIIAKFEMQPALDHFGPEAICTTGRFMLDPKLRHGTAILHLMKAVYLKGREDGIRLNYGDCSPHLVSFYEHLGFRRYTHAYNDTAYGFKLLILMLGGDRERLLQVRSPLARVAAELPDDPEAREWFARTYPDHLRYDTPALLEEGALLDVMAERIADDPLHGIGLLHDLDRGEAERFLTKATVIKAEPGDRIVRQGEPGDTLFVLLSGIADVVRDERPDEPLEALGAGDPFGEMGFLTAARRSANVVARTPCEAVVLSGHWLRTFLHAEPAIAAKVLLNLSRELAGRLADTSRRLAGATARGDARAH